MKKMRIKKLTALILVLTLALSGMLTGCGKEDIDYDINASDSENASSRGSILASNLGVPDSCDVTLDVGSSGFTSITVKSDNISTPDNDSMSYITCVKQIFDSEYKQKVCEAVFDEVYGIYVYDEEHQAKEDLQTQIDYYEALMESAISLGDSDREETYHEQIDELNKLMVHAVDELTLADDYSADEYMGCINGIKYILSFSDETENQYGDYNYISSDVSLMYYLDEELLEYRPYEGAVGFSIGAYSDSDEYDNTCEITEEEAESVALDFLSSFGVENITSKYVYDIYWEYYDGAYNVLATEYDGYSMEFTRSANGDIVTGGSLLNPLVDNSGSILHELPLFEEYYEIDVDSNGVLSMSARFLLSEENEEKNVDLISWDELTDILNSGAAEYFSGIKTGYNEIVLNDIKLTYMLLKDKENEGTYIYTPVWILTQRDDEYFEYAEDNEYDNADLFYSEITIIVNAMDGTIYNISELY